MSMMVVMVAVHELGIGAPSAILIPHGTGSTPRYIWKLPSATTVIAWITIQGSADPLRRTHRWFVSKGLFRCCLHSWTHSPKVFAKCEATSTLGSVVPSSLCVSSFGSGGVAVIKGWIQSVAPGHGEPFPGLPAEERRTTCVQLSGRSCRPLK
ncbi:unnamed protein product [Pleuronectes platessa]|uniref:Uncharacterized protein n=1 Tax=Pleuronectes platessa TaxID=8262 RepID=A0A9N7TJ99_PLEPL|nr:unnamed protein product [Pleuronectes platessa]